MIDARLLLFQPYGLLIFGLCLLVLAVDRRYRCERAAAIGGRRGWWPDYINPVDVAGVAGDLSLVRRATPR